MKKQNKHLKNSKSLYRQFLIQYLFGHLNGNGVVSLHFPENSYEPFSLLSTIRERRYFEETSLLMEEHVEDGNVKVWFFRTNCFDRLKKEIKK